MRRATHYIASDPHGNSASNFLTATLISCRIIPMYIQTEGQ